MKNIYLHIDVTYIKIMTQTLKQKLISIANEKEVVEIKKKPVEKMGYSALDAQSVFDAIFPFLRKMNIIFTTRDISIEKTTIVKEVVKNIKGIDAVIKENYVHILITGTAVFTDAESNEFVETGFFGFAEDKMDKAMPQAITIARKNALAHLFHVYGEADPEAKSENLLAIKAYLSAKREDIEQIAHSIENPITPNFPAKIFYETSEELEAMKKIFEANGYTFNEQYKTWSVPKTYSK